MWRYYLSLLQDVPRLVFEGQAWMLTVILVLAGLASLLSPELAKIVGNLGKFGRRLTGDEPWTWRSRLWAVVWLVAIVALGLMKANYARVVEIQTHADSLAVENAEWEKKLKPQFKIEIGSQAVVQSGADGLEVLLPITVANQGAPGSVVRWEFRYTSTTLDSMVLPLVLPGDSYTIKDDRGRRLAFSQSEFVMGRSASPIPQNGVLVGRQLIGVPARCLEDFENGTARITVAIYDVYGRRCESRFGAGGSTKLLVYPGESIRLR